MPDKKRDLYKLFGLKPPAAITREQQLARLAQISRVSAHLYVALATRPGLSAAEHDAAWSVIDRLFGKRG